MDIKAAEGTQKSIEVFCCYAHKDQSLLFELRMHLMPLQREGLITLWADVDMNAGTEWKEELHYHLNAAHLILLLVSPDFMASEYCYSIEMKQALERHERGDAYVIPIILRPADWQRAPFGGIQALPKDAQPVTGPNWHTQDEAFLSVEQGIRKVVEDLLKKTSTPPTDQNQMQRKGMPSLFVSKGSGKSQFPKADVNVTLFGPGGVGKTSLLAAMYDQFDLAIEKLDLQMRVLPPYHIVLQDHIDELRGLANYFETESYSYGIQGTSEPRVFSFDLGKRGSLPSLRLNYADCPGYFFTSEAHHDGIQKLLLGSEAIILTIDAPALMEERGRWNELINKPSLITQMLQDAWSNISSSRLVLLVPVKCEKYVQNSKEARKLRTAIKDSYWNLLRFFASEKLIQYITAVIIPVQTIGTHIFSRVKVNVGDGLPRFFFRKACVKST